MSSGDLPINIRWYLNEILIGDDQGITTSQFGKRANGLNIDSILGEHAGNYTCEARNYAGASHYSAELIVNGILIQSIIVNCVIFFRILYQIIFCIDKIIIYFYSYPGTHIVDSFSIIFHQ